jgi:hypothetical protein
MIWRCPHLWNLPGTFLCPIHGSPNSCSHWTSKFIEHIETTMVTGGSSLLKKPPSAQRQGPCQVDNRIYLVCMYACVCVRPAWFFCGSQQMWVEVCINVGPLFGFVVLEWKTQLNPINFNLDFTKISHGIQTKFHRNLWSDVSFRLWPPRWCLGKTQKTKCPCLRYLIAWNQCLGEIHDGLVHAT